MGLATLEKREKKSSGFWRSLAQFQGKVFFPVAAPLVKGHGARKSLSFQNLGFVVVFGRLHCFLRGFLRQKEPRFFAKLKKLLDMPGAAGKSYFVKGGKSAISIWEKAWWAWGMGLSWSLAVLVTGGLTETYKSAHG